MTDNDNDTDSTDAILETPSAADPPAGTHRSFGRNLAARLEGHRRIAQVLGLIAVAAVLGGAYVVGGPPEDHAQTASLLDSVAAERFATAGAAPAEVLPADAGSGSSKSGIQGALPLTPSLAGGQTQTNGQTSLIASIDSSQIVKTGQMALEVTDLDKAIGQAQVAVTALGGVVDQSDQSGTGDNATASITFRVPVAKWDDALAALRKVGSKVLSQQTSSSDVTSQVIDLDARLANLRTTEAALQSIMARASAIPDVIAVENQLSETRGQIEELTAESDHLKNQAAMSTLTVSLQLPTRTVTTQATQDWTLGSQVDQAGAALVRVGQGLATIAVWILVVFLPIALGALMLLAVWTLTRRILGRGRRRNAAAGA